MQNCPKTVNKACCLCHKDANSYTELRTGKIVCSQCIRSLTDGILNIESTIRKEIDRITVLFIVLFFSAIACLYFWYPSVIVPLSIGLIRKTVISKKIAALNKDKAIIYDRLGLIYELYWDIPPDWHWRREQVISRENGKCQQCGRTKWGSKVPFHVHHIIPKSESAGNHKVENLMLLCEICHGKCDSHGHHFIKRSRKKRLERNKK